MSPFYAIRYIDGQHVVGVTTDGRDFAPLPRAAFGKPRDAIRYAEMRQRAVSPLRAPGETETPSSVSPGVLTGAGK